MDLRWEDIRRHRGHSIIAGVDEVGRGALAGPVVAAAVVLPDNLRDIPEGINDSKKLSKKKRGLLYHAICRQAVSYALGIASVDEIESQGILRCSLLAMKRACEKLKPQPTLIAIDGRDQLDVSIHQETVVSGDSLVMSIAAASIIAKVTRDHAMYQLAEHFPTYGFEKHVGYGTKQHRQALRDFGCCPQHRSCFKGVGDAD